MLGSRIRQVGFVAGSLALAAGFSACGDSEGSGGSGVGGRGGKGSGNPTYADSECWSCASTACYAEHAACDGDPGCAAYLDCVRRCPIDDAGYLDETCPLACPRGEGTAAEQAIAAFDMCRTQGKGARECSSCSDACAAQPDLDPILCQTCPASSEPDECLRCQEESCCLTKSACRASPGCQAARECFNNCASEECDAACFAADPEAAATFLGDVACFVYRCTETCTGQPPNPCTACADAHCANEFAACYKSPDCFLMFECINACADGDLQCTKGCYDKYPSVQALQDAKLLCVLEFCPTECGGG